MLVEHNGDLFNCPHHMSLGHAVSGDFSMHRGLAREFRARYENVDFLKAQRMPVGTCAVLPLENRYIFYLVTKSRFYNKPTYNSVRDAFQYLKHLLDELELTQIALPGYVCCGLDKLNWTRIKQILREVFAGSGIVVHIFHIWWTSVFSTARIKLETDQTVFLSAHITLVNNELWALSGVF